MAIGRDCKLFMSIMGVVVFLAAGTGVSGSDSSQSTSASDCISPLVRIYPCLNVPGINNATAQPTKDCCSSLASVLADEHVCLCQLFHNSDFLGNTIRRTLTFTLTEACNIDTPLHNCSTEARTEGRPRAPLTPAPSRQPPRVRRSPPPSPTSLDSPPPRGAPQLPPPPLTSPDSPPPRGAQQSPLPPPTSPDSPPPPRAPRSSPSPPTSPNSPPPPRAQRSSPPLSPPPLRRSPDSPPPPAPTHWQFSRHDHDTIPTGSPKNLPSNPEGRHINGSGAGGVAIRVMIWQLFLIIALG